MLHDKAFDLGIITIDKDLIVCGSEKTDMHNDDYFDTSIRSCNSKKILLPKKFQPDSECLDYHRENVFENWLKQ